MSEKLRKQFEAETGLNSVDNKNAYIVWLESKSNYIDKANDNQISKVMEDDIHGDSL